MHDAIYIIYNIIRIYISTHARTHTHTNKHTQSACVHRAVCVCEGVRVSVSVWRRVCMGMHRHRRHEQLEALSSI